MTSSPVCHLIAGPRGLTGSMSACNKPFFETQSNTADWAMVTCPDCLDYRRRLEATAEDMRKKGTARPLPFPEHCQEGKK